MSEHQISVDVQVPVRTAYDQWTQFETFPQFMEGVESVQQLTDRRLHWVAKVGGVKREWDAEITEQRPDERVAWMSTTGHRNAGAVTFHRLDDSNTRVVLNMDIDPEGFVENVGDKLGVIDRRLEGDMLRFKDFIESRGLPTGAWRGNIPRPDERLERNMAPAGASHGMRTGPSDEPFRATTDGSLPSR